MRVAGVLLCALVSELGCGAVDEGVDVSLGRAEQGLAMRANRMWLPAPGQTRVIIPICFKNGTPAQRTQTRALALAGWANINDEAGDTRFGVEFTEFVDCPPDPRGKFISIVFQPTPSGGGLTWGLGRQSLDYDPSVELEAVNQYVVPHELGHVLGFGHEFERSDFPLEDSDCPQDEQGWPDLALSELDPPSVMSYPNCNGNLVEITENDKLGFRRVYGPLALNSGDRVLLRGDIAFVDGGTTVPQVLPNVSPTSIARLVHASSAASQAPLRFGDRVRIQLPNGRLYGAPHAGRSLVPVTQVGSGVSTGTEFKIEGGAVGTPVMVNQPLKLLHVDNHFALIVVNGRLNMAPGNGTAWTLHTMGGPGAI